jgi:alpha 1,2-mannosyltransferase
MPPADEPLITICHRCDFREVIINGQPCLCSVSGRDIQQHADSGICPMRQFNLPPTKRFLRSPVNQSKRYLALLREALNLLPPCRDGFAGRGIVVCGGGKYFESVYVTLRVLRHLGYDGPIELWYLPGEIFPWMVEALEPLNVTLVDAADSIRRHPAVIRMTGEYSGYQLKPYAILNSSFAEVLYIDADAYPIKPDFLRLFDSPQYAECGAVFFPDSEDQDLRDFQWSAFGLADRREAAFESGVIYIDKRRCWRELNLALWICQHEYFFTILLGDKDAWHIAWRLLEREYAMPGSRWTWPDRTRPPQSPGHQAAMIQYDFDGNPLFAHRTVSKFSLKENVDLSLFQTTRQIVIKRDDRIPLEDFCWECLHDLRRLRSRHLVLHRLESCGDILTLLPAWKYLARDYAITVVTHRKYLPLLEGIEWLTVLPWDGPATDAGAAVRHYQAAGQWREADPLEQRKSWSMQAWAQTGVPDELFDELPLELENRDMAAEADILREHVGPADCRPLVLLNTTGVTSPYPHGETLRLCLAKYADRLRFLDLSLIRAPRFIDLCGLYERACLLISTDTATLHLGYWNRIPTIALLRDPDGQGPRAEFGSSEPRRHWIEKMTYKESATAAGLERIEAAIERAITLPPCPTHT